MVRGGLPRPRVCVDGECIILFSQGVFYRFVSTTIDKRKRISYQAPRFGRQLLRSAPVRGGVGCGWRGLRKGEAAFGRWSMSTTRAVTLLGVSRQPTDEFLCGGDRPTALRPVRRGAFAPSHRCSKGEEHRRGVWGLGGE